MSKFTGGCEVYESLRLADVLRVQIANLRYGRLKICATLLAFILCAALASTAAAQSFATTNTVGRKSDGAAYTPVNQILTPLGMQVELSGLRPQVLALSPDGRLLVTSGKNHALVVVDPDTGKVLQHVPLPPERGTNSAAGPVSEQILQPDKEGQASYTGLIFSPDGRRIYLANVDGSIKVFGVEPNGKVSGLFSLPLPLAKVLHREADIPAGLAVSADGRRLYVVLNMSNRLAEFDATTGQWMRMWDVGVAPYAVVLAANKAYVSNWGGRRPDSSSVTGPAGHGVRVRVDPVRYIAKEGSVSVIHLSDPWFAPPTEAGTVKAAAEIITGLHASALALSPNRRWLVVANSGSDTLSVIDTRTDQVVETIWARQNPADLFGAQPNALAFDKSGRTLFVANGSQNAIGVVDFEPGHSHLRGLIPVGWYPAAVVYDQHRRLLDVANLKGLSPGRERASGRVEFNSHQYHGSLSLIKVPGATALSRHTRSALSNLRYPLLEQAALPPRVGRSPQPVPERTGEPSVFKHLVYIIKENRTYDQVLGDVKRGNGDPALCVFGQRVTPNQHKLVSEFVLLDNTYCSGILSADGHQWTDSAMANDYMEKSFAGFPRSYPDGMGDGEIDALAYSSAGFIWDNALAHGKTLRDYGEFAITVARWKDADRKDRLRFEDFYQDYTNHAGAIDIYSRPGIESLRPYLATNTAGWDLNIPDVFRAEQFIKELREFENQGDLPNLVLICLPNDHTSGTKPQMPTPAAHVADNDVAFGRIVESISHSRFWPDTCVFAIEDDPQSGWDHVSGYRTTAYVASPYTRRGAVVSTQYNHTSLLRTIELMLGLPAMNQFDATATPMFDCFTNVPDLTPFSAVPNIVRLDELNPVKLSDASRRKDAWVSAHLPLDQPDRCPDDVLNRILWRALKGTTTPYPAGQTASDVD